LFWEKKQCDEIRKRNRDHWTLNDIQALLTYKKQKDDQIIQYKRIKRTERHCLTNGIVVPIVKLCCVCQFQFL
jgi:hypothetical protein